MVLFTIEKRTIFMALSNVANETSLIVVAIFIPHNMKVLGYTYTIVYESV